MMRCRSLLLLVVILNSTVPAVAQDSWPPIPVRRGAELVIVGAHDVAGRIAGQGSFRGRLEIGADARYRLARVFDDETALDEKGLAKIAGSELVLTPDSGAARAFKRSDLGREIRWLYKGSGAQEEILPRQKKESELRTLARLLKRRKSAVNWVLKANEGVVDAAGGGIARSKQPTPNFLEAKVKSGLRTLVSLNGDQAKSMTYTRPNPKDGASAIRVQVELRDFIAQLGLEHHVFRMSAKRAPSDKELVEIFRLLLDDRKRPLLLHCTGGADRTGVIAALYQIEFLGLPKAEAKKAMRHHMWAAHDGTEIQGAYLDLYQLGYIRGLLKEAGFKIPARYRSRSSSKSAAKELQREPKRERAPSAPR